MALCNQPVGLASDLGDDQSHYLYESIDVCDVVSCVPVLTECNLCVSQPEASLDVATDVEPVAFSSTTDVEEQSDLLQNLLGVSDAQALDKMLDSADNAAALLGVKPEQNGVLSAATVVVDEA